MAEPDEGRLEKQRLEWVKLISIEINVLGLTFRTEYILGSKRGYSMLFHMLRNGHRLCILDFNQLMSQIQYSKYTI
jgi:hypothetical protein